MTAPLAAVGAAAAAVLVTASARAPVPVGVVLPEAFGGLLRPDDGPGTAQAAAVVLALAVLTACWWSLLDRAARGTLGQRGVLAVVAAWTAPLLLGPPLLSLDAYAYLAQGAMLLEGLDPYAVGPVVLADASVRDRVDPFWRASPTPYGPLALLLLGGAARVSALAGGALEPGVLLLRAAALLAAAGAAAAGLRLAAPERRPWVLAAVAGNPVLLVHLVGGVHVDALLAGLATLTLAQLLAGRPGTAWWCAVGAVAVKVTAAPLLLLVLVALYRSGRPGVALVGRGAVTAALAVAAAGLVVDRPWGFLGALLVPGSAPSWYAPATLAGRLLAAGEVLPDGAARLAGGVLVLSAGTALVARLLLAEARRPAGPTDAATLHRGALVLVVPALCLPSLYGWYLGAGLVTWVVAAGRRGRLAVVALSSALGPTSLPPLHAADRGVLALAWCAALALLAVCAVRRRPWAEPAPAPRAAVPPHGRWRPAPAAAALLVVGALVPGVAVGAHADSALRDPTTRSQEAALVRQLAGQYPTLRVTRLTRLDRQRWQVVLTQPGVRVCELTAVLPAGPLAAYQRRDALVAGRRPRPVDERVCPRPRL